MERGEGGADDAVGGGIVGILGSDMSKLTSFDLSGLNSVLLGDWVAFFRGISVDISKFGVPREFGETVDRSTHR